MAYRIYLSCEKDHIEARYYKAGKVLKPMKRAEIRTMKELHDFCAANPHEVILCSSSLDFPREYTKSRAIIRLCDQIRNGR